MDTMRLYSITLHWHEEIEVCLKEAHSLMIEASTMVADELGMTKENCPTFSGFMNWSSFRNATLIDVEMLGYKLGNQLVAYGAVDLKKADRPTLRFIAVDPKFQHCGLGRMVMNQLEQRLISHGIMHSHLGAIAENKKLIKWYETLGYKIKRTMKLGKSDYHVCMMKKEL